ncbi:MAG: peptidoglycan-binding protein [Kofleriaceae bacterium]|nr:peptidoglycan-binding protein [Kofleriaceae bacterium]
MGERAHVEDEDCELDTEAASDGASGDRLPMPTDEDALAVERDDQDRARGLADLQMEHGTLDEPDLDDDEDHDEGKKKRTKSAPALGSLRFSDDAALVKVARKKSKLAKGDAGIHVTKVQQALAELGHLDGKEVSGTFDDATTAAVKAFQGARGLTASGKVDAATMRALDAAFSVYTVEAGRAMGKTPSTMPTKGVPYAVGTAPKELLDGTHVPTAKERKAFAKAISTEQVADASGKLPKFKSKKKGVTYESRLETLVGQLVDRQLVWAKGADTARSAGHVYDWGDIDKVAAESAKATDAVFGKYAVGNPLTGTGVAPNIKDAWDHKEAQLGADASLADDWAHWRIEKLLTGSKAVKELDKEHGAIQSRATEKAIVDRVHARLASSRKADLVLIHKAWPAFASGGNVFIQRTQERDSTGKVDNAKGRDYMWEMFQTVIHEYIHTLEHPEHRTYRSGMDQQKGGFTLREGVTDYFTKVAYNATAKTPALRKAVEGPFHEGAVLHAIPALTTYGESENAERGAAIVGFDNMAAAFFLGQLELIGKT